MTFFTVLALLCVRPNVPNVGPYGEGDVIAATQSTSPANSDEDPSTGSLPASGQMPEIEVNQFGGELLHASTFRMFVPVVVDLLFPASWALPRDKYSAPLLRPPQA